MQFGVAFFAEYTPGVYQWYISMVVVCSDINIRRKSVGLGESSVSLKI